MRTFLFSHNKCMFFFKSVIEPFQVDFSINCICTDVCFSQLHHTSATRKEPQIWQYTQNSDWDDPVMFSECISQFSLSICGPWLHQALVNSSTGKSGVSDLPLERSASSKVFSLESVYELNRKTNFGIAPKILIPVIAPVLALETRIN